jgi:segregation and condensation protein A
MSTTLQAPIDDRPEQPYLVRLQVFEGPLDLLLHLIEKQELDITAVSLAAVTDQYLEYMRHLERVSAENLADFLVVAAKLLLIKSRALLPAPPAAEGEEEEDLAEELAQQLREYKRFKELAQQLGQREADGLRAYLRVAAMPRLDRELDLSGISLDDLLAAVQEALSLQPESEPLADRVAPLAISISDKIQSIETMLAQRSSFSFHRFLRQATSRAEIIVSLLALLQLIKAGRARVRQEQLFGDILVLAPDRASPQLAAPQQGQQ